MKSTLTVLLGLVLMFMVAIIAYPKLQNQSKNENKKTSMLVVKNTGKEVSTKPIHVSFGLNASFAPKTEN